MEILKITGGPLAVNTWLLPSGSDRLVIVDPGAQVRSIIAAVERSGRTPESIWLTHGHFDHLGALQGLMQHWSNLKLAIHPADGTWLGSGALARHKAFISGLGWGSLVSGYTGELPEASLFLENGMELSGWKIIHTPGHSPGSVCFYNEAGSVLVSGDTLFADGIGRSDGPGGSQQSLYSSLSLILELPDSTRVLPGHGPETTIGRERENLRWISAG